jgi:hypothetical protein
MIPNTKLTKLWFRRESIRGRWGSTGLCDVKIEAP